jgi:hypothetical protein
MKKNYINIKHMKRNNILQKVKNGGSVLRRGFRGGKRLAGKINTGLGGLPLDVAKFVLAHKTLAALA